MFAIGLQILLNCDCSIFNQLICMLALAVELCAEHAFFTTHGDSVSGGCDSG